MMIFGLNNSSFFGFFNHIDRNKRSYISSANWASIFFLLNLISAISANTQVTAGHDQCVSRFSQANQTLFSVTIISYSFLCFIGCFSVRSGARIQTIYTFDFKRNSINL